MEKRLFLRIGLIFLFLWVTSCATPPVAKAPISAVTTPSKIEALLGRPPANDEETAIAQLFVVQIEAIKKNDAKLYMSVYSKDAKIKTVGWGMIPHGELAGKMNQYINDIANFSIKDLKVSIDGTKATAIAFKSFNSRTGGPSVAKTYSYTLRKEGEKWRIINENFN